MLYHGDCLEVMAQLIADGIKVDAIIADPPYGTTACKWDSVIPFDKMWPLLNALIKPKGAIVLFGSEPFSSALRMSNIKNYKYDWIWDKVKPGSPTIAKYQPLRIVENICIFNGLNYYPIMEKRNTIKHSGKCKTGIRFLQIESDLKDRVYTDKYPKNILHYSNASQVNKYHPTQKPVALMEYLIKTYTLEGETVLDFTMGSGSTGVACVNTNREFTGIELDNKYFDIATNRIKEAISDAKSRLI